MALSNVLIDSKMFVRVQLFSSEPSMKWDKEARTTSDEPEVTDDGRPYYNVRLAVLYAGGWNRDVSDVIEVKLVDPTGEDPSKIVGGLGKEVLIEGLTMRVSVSSGGYLQQYFSADRLTPVRGSSAAVGDTPARKAS